MGHAPSSPCLSCAVECSNAFEHRLVSGPPSFHSKTADGSGNDIHASSSQNDLAASRRQSIGPPPYTGSFILPPNSPPIYDVMLTTEPLEHPHSSPSINFSAAEKSMVLRDPHLNHNPTRLLSLINCIVENLPKLYVRIRGVSLEGFHRRTDFDVKIDLTKLYTSRGSSSRMGEVRTIGSGVLGYRGRAKKSVLPEITDLDGLEKWVKMYCEDSSRSKRFTIRRTVTGINTNDLYDRFSEVIDSVGYWFGDVDITFPAMNTAFKIKSPHKHTGVAAKKYEVVTVVWPAADDMREEVRQFVGQTEDDFILEWKDAMQYAIRSKRRGWLIEEDKDKAREYPDMHKGVSSIWWPATKSTRTYFGSTI